VLRIHHILKRISTYGFHTKTAGTSSLQSTRQPSGLESRISGWEHPTFLHIICAAVKVCLCVEMSKKVQALPHAQAVVQEHSVCHHQGMQAPFRFQHPQEPSPLALDLWERGQWIESPAQQTHGVLQRFHSLTP
jgi:hypothetical protein